MVALKTELACFHALKRKVDRLGHDGRPLRCHSCRSEGPDENDLSPIPGTFNWISADGQSAPSLS